jgi:hypothetical protein
MKPTKFQSATHFKPLDEDEHRRGNCGYPVTDRCINCGWPFMDHYNGQCPADEDEDEEGCAP